MSHSRTLTVLLGSLLLLACSTPKEAAKVAVPPPENRRDLPLEPPAPGSGRICKLGDSCLTMDSRPFEACLVGTRHCAEKAVETMPADVPLDGARAPQSIKIRE